MVALILICLGLLVLFSPPLLIIGLIKPRIILFWSKKPTRLKVAGWWFLLVLTCCSVIMVCFETGRNNDGLRPKKNRKTGKWGYVEKGKEVIPFQYDAADAFSPDLAKVKLNGKYGFINRTGDEVIPLIYDEIDYFFFFRKRIFKAGLNCKYGLLNINGEEVVPIKYDAIRYSDMEKLAHVRLNNKYGLIDSTGSEVVMPKYDVIGSIWSGKADVQLEGKKGRIDQTGKELIPPKYDELGYYLQEKGTIVKLNGKYGFVGEDGMEIALPLYDEIAYFTKDMLKAVKDGEIFYIDINGLVYAGRESPVIENLATQLGEIHKYHSKLQKESGGSGYFTFQSPYLILDVNNNRQKEVDVWPKYNNNMSVNNAKTLIVKYDYFDFDEGYKHEYNKSSISADFYISSYGTYLVYFDMETNTIIGHDNLRGPSLPRQTSDLNNRYNTYDKIISTILSHQSVPLDL